MTNYGALATCQLLNTACVDTFVTGQVLAALAPAAVEVSLTAAGQVLAERAELEKVWSQRLERAEHDADRARRCYHLAEPENRLLVRQLEKDWENALAAQQRLREEHDHFTHTSPAPSAPPNSRPSPIWPATSPACGTRRRPRSGTGRRSSARSSTRSS
ncbi:hypothetical protein [Streptomyces sp. A5-4]|uniref:hypothetical protein n=1 Tax=Streptomyces sp. A5-4 TaxID=3384771 RepID=UPI003DA7D1D6